MRLYIEKQNYPDFRGERPTSYAIWLKRCWWQRRQFLGYCREFGRAWQIAAVIVKSIQHERRVETWEQE